MESFIVSEYVNSDISLVYEDFKKRKEGIVKALTTDHKTLFEDLKAGHGLHLYGDSDGGWKLTQNAERDLPRPSERLFLCGEEQDLKVWVKNAVTLCQNWLLSVACFHATKKGLDKLARKIVFNLIFELPTVSNMVANESFGAIGFLKEKAADYDIFKYVSKDIKMESFIISEYVINPDISWVYENFRKRKEGIVKALTTDYESLFERCKEDENGSYLYGKTDGAWDLTRSINEDLPLPSNYLFHCKKDENLLYWLEDAVNLGQNWLLSVADFYATKKSFDKLARKVLFDLIFELPTVSDVVIDVWEDIDEVAMEREGCGKFVWIIVKDAWGKIDKMVVGFSAANASAITTKDAYPSLASTIL